MQSVEESSPLDILTLMVVFSKSKSQEELPCHDCLPLCVCSLNRVWLFG